MKPRPGFTILELLLVLALLVTIASLAAPQVGRTLDSHRLRGAAEELRAVWSKARVRAMEQGRTYVFRSELSGSQYQVEPLVSPDDYLESSQLSLGNAAMASVAGSKIEAAELPDKVTFAGTQLAQDFRAMTLNPAAAAATAAAEPTGTLWSTPVYFYPDGTTTTAKLRVVNERDRGIEISMRGLTGVIYVKDVSGEGLSRE